MLRDARELRERLPNRRRIVLIDRTVHHVFAPSLLWLLVGDRNPTQITRDLNRLRRHEIDVVHAEVRSIDPAQREVLTDAGRFEADFLVLALGAKLAHDNFYCLRGAEMARDALTAFSGGRLAFLVGGTPLECRAAPYEAAMLADHLLRRRRVRSRTEIHLYTPEPHPMPVAGAAVGAGVQGLLQERGIAYHPNRRIRHIEEKALVFADGETGAFDLLLGVPPHRPPDVVTAAGLATNGDWVAVDRNSLATRFGRVWALGDLAGIPLSGGRALPKAGVFARREAEVVAQNVADAIADRPQTAAFVGEGECFVETGGGRAAFARGNFYHEPAPALEMAQPARRWHWAKLAVEQLWLGKF